MKRQKSFTWISGVVVFLLLSGLFSSPSAVQAVASIPAGATITSATLSLFVDVTDGVSVRAHNILANWDELSVTYNNFPTGDFDPAVVNTLSPVPGWSTVNVTSSVQGWVDGTLPNYGLLLDELNPTSYTTFESSEAVTLANRPKLDVCYTTPADQQPTCLTIQRPGDPHVDVLDSYIWQNAPDTNNGNNPELFAGILPFGNGLKMTLIRFDIAVVKTPGVTIVKKTNGAVASDPNGADVPQIKPGDPITWTYTVTNTGQTSVPLADVVVTDNQTGVTPAFDSEVTGNADAIFDPGEVWLFKATGSAVNLLLPPPAVIPTPNGCTLGGALPPHNAYVNIGTVTIPGANAQAPSSYCNKPDISIVKRTNGQLATDPNGLDVPQIKPGDPITWTYTVTNIGAVPIKKADVVVTDSQSGVTPVYDSEVSGNADAVFDPNEVWLFKATGSAVNLILPPQTVVATPNGCTLGGALPPHNSYINIGTVTVPGAVAHAPSSYCNTPDVSIVKRTNGLVASDPNGTDVPQIKPGDTVTWTYDVTNTGFVPIKKADVVVTDNQTGVTPVYDHEVTGNADLIFDPGEVWEFKASGIAVDLSTPPGGVITVQNSCSYGNKQLPRTAYVNQGTVTIPGATKSAQSSYCNPGIFMWYGPFAYGQVKPIVQFDWQLALGYEDLPLLGGQNDFDYNDWTVDVNGSNFYDAAAPTLITKMVMHFMPHARGAAYDHRFQILIPANAFKSNGTVVTNIYDKDKILISSTATPFNGAAGGTYIIFPKTSEALPGSIVNTVEGTPFTPPQRFADLTFTFDTPFPFIVNENDMGLAHGTGLFFDPYLVVLNTGDQVHIGDLRMLSVPSTDYLWPEERVRIDKAYPDIHFIPGPLPDFTFPPFWWTNHNHCIYDGVACVLP